MKKLRLPWLLTCLALVMLPVSQPAFAAGEFAFGFIAHPFSDALADESDLRQSLAELDRKNLAFVVVGGIKSGIEPCSDQLYQQRRSLLEQAKNGVIVSLAASDWSDCRYRNGRTAAQERLHRVRELFFADEMSFGASKIPLIRQSGNAKFRDYAENARWEIGDIMFATVNLPANNNRYLSAAGRNSEFEDRLMANRDWLQRILMYATRQKHRGIVIFCDGNPLYPHARANGERDGFRETRQQLIAMAAKFPGRILLIPNQSPLAANAHPDNIRWKGNLGDLPLASGWTKVQVSPAQGSLFSTSAGPREKTSLPTR